MENRDMQYINMPSMQERPITLGELLLREERLEEMELAPTRSMGRSMSPTRCLGSLANGHPRRARGRTMTRQSTSADEFDDNHDESQPSRLSQDRRRRTPVNSLTLPALARWHTATAEARLRNFYTIMNGPRPSRRRGASAAARPRQRSLERAESPDLFYNPFSWQRRSGSSLARRYPRSRSATNAVSRSRSTLHGRSQRLRSSRYNSREGRSSVSYRCRRSGRPHSGRPEPETPNNSTNTQSELPASMRRFINFAAEFIPVEEPSSDEEPPEWSLNITAANFGPFAVGRSALSRARVLAVMGALSQIPLPDERFEAQSNPAEN